MRARAQPCTSDRLPGNGALGLFLANRICAVDETARQGFQCWRYQYSLPEQTYPVEEIRGNHATHVSRRALGLSVVGNYSRRSKIQLGVGQGWCRLSQWAGTSDGSV